jgi:hypothetical protein
MRLSREAATPPGTPFALFVRCKLSIGRNEDPMNAAGGSAIGKGTGPVPLPQHCTNLAKAFDEEAANYAALAQAHRELAKAAK